MEEQNTTTIDNNIPEENVASNDADAAPVESPPTQVESGRESDAAAEAAVQDLTANSEENSHQENVPEIKQEVAQDETPIAAEIQPESAIEEAIPENSTENPLISDKSQPEVSEESDRVKPEEIVGNEGQVTEKNDEIEETPKDVNNESKNFGGIFGFFKKLN